MITSHILDTSTGKPGEGIAVNLFFLEKNDPMGWIKIAEAKSDEDGRINEWLTKEPESGTYKIRFDTKEYFGNNSIDTFYPYVEIIFEVQTKEHYHVPLLISPFGYSTYRGS